MSLIIQTSVPSYRLNVYKEITQNLPNVNIISGKTYYSDTIKSDKNTPNVIWVKNVFLLKRKFLYQQLPWIKVFKSNSVIIEFNLHNISFHLVILIRLLLNKKTHLWGHAWSRAGKNSKSEYLRLMYKKICSGYIAYTQTQRKELQKQIPDMEVYGANNSIYFKHDMVPIKKPKDKVTNFIYVGLSLIHI